MYLPSWGDLTSSRNRKAHAMAVGVFLSIMAVLLIGVTVVYVTQLNVIATVKQENVQKVDYARTTIESDLQSVKSTVTTASINPDLVTAVGAKDISSLTDLSRIILTAVTASGGLSYWIRAVRCFFFIPSGYLIR